MKKLKYLIPIFSGIFFGSAGIFVRGLSEAGFSDITIIAQRSLFSAVILAMFLWFYDRALLKVRVKDLWMFAVTGVGIMMVVNLTYNVSARHLTLSFAGVLLASSPIFTLIFSHFLFGEKITIRKIICIALALLGCCLLSGIANPGVVKIEFFGIFMGVLSSIFYSLYGLVSKVIMKRGYQALTITFYSILFIAIALLVFADWKGIVFYAMESPVKNTTFLIVHALSVSVLSYVLFTIGVGLMDVSKVSILASCEPAAAMVFGVLLFQEIPSVFEVCGLVLTVIAVSVMCMEK